MSEFVNRLGVNVVEGVCLRLEWFFREQHVSDQGVDAIVEKAPDEVGSGRLLAIQIKSGESYFREPSDDGWWFRFGPDKAKLWLGHALPVVVVLVDVDNGTAYWQRIGNHTVTSTGKGYKVEVPRTQNVRDADSEWTELASGLELRAIDRWELALTQLPPSVRNLLDDSSGQARPDAAILAVHLAEGRGNPRDTAQALLTTSPGWMARQSPSSWRTLAAYCAEHDVPDLSADAFERAAADRDAGYGKFLGSAALNVLSVDRKRSGELLAQARRTGDAPLLVTIVEALLDHPEGDAGPCRIDPILLGDSDAVGTSRVAQAFLCDQAMRSGDHDTACLHARLAQQADADDSSIMMLRARALIRRAHSSRRQEDDVPTAITLLEQALDQRRRWAGPTLAVMWSLAEAYAYDGQFDKMLQLCRPLPLGAASAEEAEDPSIRRAALYAADALGRQDLVQDMVVALDDSVQDRIACLKIGLLSLTPAEEAQLWNEELSRAVSSDDYSAVGFAAVALAFHGIDARNRVAPFVERSIIPGVYLELIGALLNAANDLDAALPELRSLARRDPLCAEYSIMLLTRVGRHRDVADLCETLYEYNRNPYYLVIQAMRLIRVDDEAAESVALRAVSSTSAFPTERADLEEFPGMRAVARDAWPLAERHLADAIRLRADPSSVEVWRLVYCQVKQGRLRRAAATIAEHRPTVTDVEQAQLWIQAHTAVAWDEAIASEALALAQELNDPIVSTALLGQIITSTRGVSAAGEETDRDDGDTDAGLEQRRQAAQRSVPADLHRQAFAVLQQLVGRFGERTGVTILQGDPDHLAEQAVATMRDMSDAAIIAEEALAGVRDARLPQGFVAAAIGRSYATALVQRSFGLLIGAASGDDEHAMEIEAAGRALNGPVVVDTSALLALTGLSSRSRLQGQFTAMHYPAESMRDIYRAAYDVRSLAGSPGSTNWSRQHESVIFYELAADEYTRQLRRAQVLEDLAEQTTVRVVPGASLFRELNEARHAPWAHPIQLAYDQGFALWSDDLGQRRVARGFEVPTFGTSALIDALRDRRLIAATSAKALDEVLQQTAADNRELANDLVVDVVLHLEDLTMIAEREDWQPQAGAVVISRPAWWAWQAEPIDDLMKFLQQVAAFAPACLPAWQHAAMIGAGRAFIPSGAAGILAVLALLGFGTEPTLEDLVDGMRRARQVAKELNLPDPLLQMPAAASSLSSIGKCADPGRVSAIVLEALRAEDFLAVQDARQPE